VRPLHAFARTVDDASPDRDRYVDLLRLVTIGVAVLGRWLATVVVPDAQHRPVARSALAWLPWAAPLTWLFQLIPVFFVLTGYTNAALLVGDLRNGRDLASWLRGRGARLVPTATVMLLVFSGSALAATLAGADPVVARATVRTVAAPLWFFGVYLILVLLTPVMYRLHKGFGVRIMVVLVLLVGLGDAARFGGEPALGAGNYLFGWLAIHQVGFFWYDGRLRFGRRASLALLGGGFAVVVLLTVAGPYPVAMIGVPEPPVNVWPPSLALLALTAGYLGLFLLPREPAERWLHRRRPWRVVISVNAVALTIFLWQTATVALAAAPLWTVHALPGPPVDSWQWWAWRVPWLLLLTVTMAVLVAVFGPVELRPRGRDSPHPRASARLRLPLAVLGFLATIAGLMVNSFTPAESPEPLGIPTAALAMFLSGALLLRVLRRLG